MKVEILSPVDHGIGKEVTRYEPGVHSLPYDVALELLQVRRTAYGPNGSVEQVPMCRLAL
ncbi:MAG TPA: hypothetical protein VMX16_18070 [Terriglobia bacterium]|nr:hypothetical protein [Terriglobia bacterium]